MVIYPWRSVGERMSSSHSIHDMGNLITRSRERERETVDRNKQSETDWPKKTTAADVERPSLGVQVFEVGLGHLPIVFRYSRLVCIDDFDEGCFVPTEWDVRSFSTSFWVLVTVVCFVCTLDHVVEGNDHSGVGEKSSEATLAFVQPYDF